MKSVTATIEKITIPTYETGKAEKNPVFLEKRVYQGSTGKVYPYPVIESISDTKKDKEYEAVILENEYLKVMVLPELGGRIQRAFDKTNGYDFVYYNHVIKPALVGLTGPWISGGIEFNWPQHHRPTTFLPVNYEIRDTSEGGKIILLNDVDQMYGTKVITKIALYPDKSYIEIEGQLYNRTSLPQTFLWWANPAVPVNENTQSIFPPDVHAVMDHGKRDVSRFPIATGVYYKKDYSEGVDISRYKNIPVPTSYMAEKSEYDFVGGYDYGKEAGILHVADHHVSPGKKQWTWGCGDFGKAWDLNLTDEDGPYVELMTGVYTDNQPDFTWLKPFEEKCFKQYFMPYKKIGQVKNATIDAALSLFVDKEQGTIKVYATSTFANSKIKVTGNGQTLLETTTTLSPNCIYEDTFALAGCKEEELTISVLCGTKQLVAYTPKKQDIKKLPDPATAALMPEEIQTNEELYLNGLHMEQYRHATYLPDPYYLEGLKRDPKDIRINNAYGTLLLRRGNFTEAQKHFETAMERLTLRNPNPYDSEAYYNLGLALFYREEYEKSYDAFYKSTWTSEQQERSFYYMAAIKTREKDYSLAYDFVEKALIKNSHNVRARGLKAYLLRMLEAKDEAMTQLEENITLDPFDYVSGYEMTLLSSTKVIDLFTSKLGNFEQNYLLCARDYASFGAYEEACQVLKLCDRAYPLIKYYEAYYESKLGNGEMVNGLLTQAECCSPDYCFPNCLEDISVLEYAISHGSIKMAPYYLGNLYYDKLQYEKAITLWEQAVLQNDSFPTVHRNLSIAYYNKHHDSAKAVEELEKAFALNSTDARILLELNQLYIRTGKNPEERLAFLEKHYDLLPARDDLYIEYLSLLNQTEQYEKTYELIMEHHFHPWEGGEGRVTCEYRHSLIEMAKKAIFIHELEQAEVLLQQALIYPANLGEGKLEGTKDNDIHYYLGEIYSQKRDSKKAKQEYELATLGTNEPAGMMYYNDQPADMILYQGLAYLRLQELGKANGRFYRLIDFGERHLEDEVKIEYFAVSLPDLSVFDDDYTLRNKAHCNYLMALGNIGLGHLEQAKEFLLKALEIEPSHKMAAYYLNNI